MECPEGKEYYPETRKCYKKCLEKQFRNPPTRRCKNKPIALTLKNPKKTKKKKLVLEGYSSPSPLQEEEIDIPQCITNSKIPLYPHQLRVVSFLTKNRGLIAIHAVSYTHLTLPTKRIV